jgi:hypothetical protein
LQSQLFLALTVNRSKQAQSLALKLKGAQPEECQQHYSLGWNALQAVVERLFQNRGLYSAATVAQTPECQSAVIWEQALPYPLFCPDALRLKDSLVFHDFESYLTPPRQCHHSSSTCNYRTIDANANTDFKVQLQYNKKLNACHLLW